MVLRLIQLETEAGERQCAVVKDDGSATLIEGYTTTYELCLAALRAKKSMNEFIQPTITKGAPVDYDAALEAGRVLPPIDHPDPAHSVRPPDSDTLSSRPLRVYPPHVLTTAAVRTPSERDGHWPDAPWLRSRA